jgi:hypothetical protein
MGTAAPNAASPFGVVGAMRWPNWGTFHAPADAVLAAGGGWVREDFVWGLIEPTPGHFQWTATDRIVSTLKQRGINILGIISYSASWATPTSEDDGSPISFYPPDNSKYYWFVRTLVSRYKDSVRHWEVWNEPDNPLFWKPRPDPRQYAELLKTAHRAIKDADPSAKVVSGGVSGNAIPFLEEMLKAGAGNSFDILGLHPYAVPLNPSQARIESHPEVHKMVDVELNKYRAFLQRHGHGNKAIWVTELGWPARNWQLDDQTQADYLAQSYAQMLASGLTERIFWYSFKDESADPKDSWGLIAWGAGKTDLNPKRPALAAYSTAARMLTGTRPAGRVQIAPFQTVEGFEQPGAWVRSFHPLGSFTSGQAAAPHPAREGGAAGKLEYSFTDANQAVDFAPPQPLPIAGKPTRLGIWVVGDSSGNYLSAWLRDKHGELFKVRFGSVTAPADGWRYYEAAVNTYYFDWERALGDPPNGVVNYPVSFIGFRLENTPDHPPGKGTIYVDNLQAYDGQDVSVVRFTRQDGQAVDVLWAPTRTQLSLPTRSDRAEVIQRDGASRTLASSGGTLALEVGNSPVYVVHRPPEQPAGPRYAGADPAGGTGGQQQRTDGTAQSAMCAAYRRAGPLQEEGSLYFPETGHNLRGRFRTYWERNGGLFIFGYPITEEFAGPSSDGKTYVQQYFQRARFEYHPENAPPNDVQLGLLGVWLTAGRTFPRSQPGADNLGTMFFPQTGQSIALFKGWWTRNGGLAVFGYPISPELQERNPSDGKVYTVQYFERNRLEHHPEHAGTPYETMLGLLGTEYLNRQGCR